MKKLLFTSMVLLALGAMAQPTGNDRNFETSQTRSQRDRSLQVKPERMDRIEGRHFTYTGIVVQAIKADNPLQLINPAAPAKYGTAEANAVREPKTGRVLGLKLLSLEF